MYLSRSCFAIFTLSNCKYDEEKLLSSLYICFPTNIFHAMLLHALQLHQHRSLSNGSYVLISLYKLIPVKNPNIRFCQQISRSTWEEIINCLLYFILVTIDVCKNKLLTLHFIIPCYFLVIVIKSTFVIADMGFAMHTYDIGGNGNSGNTKHSDMIECIWNSRGKKIIFTRIFKLDITHLLIKYSS